MYSPTNAALLILVTYLQLHGGYASQALSHSNIRSEQWPAVPGDAGGLSLGGAALHGDEVRDDGAMAHHQTEAAAWGDLLVDPEASAGQLWQAPDEDYEAWRWAHGDYFMTDGSSSSKDSDDLVAMTDDYDSENVYDMDYGWALEPDVARRQDAQADPTAAALEGAPRTGTGTGTGQGGGGNQDDSTMPGRAAVSRRLLRFVRGLPG